MVFDALEGELGLDKSDFTRGLQAASKETAAFGKMAEGTFEDVGDEAAEAGAETAASSSGFDKLKESISDTVVPTKLLTSTVEEAGDEASEAGDEAAKAGAEAATSATGFGRLQNAVEDTIVPTQLFESSIDEAGDEVSEAGRKAFGATAGFAALQFSTSGLSFSLGVLTTVGTSTALMLGGLAIAAGAVTTALLPVAVGAAAVAAAFGVIIGSGIYAGMKELKNAFKSARKEIAPMVKELGEEFVPFLKETIQMLPGLVSNIIDALGPLDQFKSALKTLRDAAFDLLPKFISWFIELGKWALPILIDLGNWIVNSLAPALRRLIKRGKSLFKTFQRLAPKFQKILDVARGVWNWVQDLWKSFQKTVKNSQKLRKKFQRLIKAAKRFWKNLQPVIKALKPLAKQLIRLAPFVAGIAIDLATLATTIGAKLLPFLRPLIQIVTRIVKWFNDLAPPIKLASVVVGGLAAALVILIPMLKAAVVAVLAMSAPISLTTAAIIALGIAVVALADYVYKNWNQIVKWTKSLASDIKWWMGKIGSWISDNIMGPVNDLINWLKNDAKGDIIGVFDSIASGIGNAFKGAFNAAIPSSVPIPSVTIGAGQPGPDYTIGGGALDLPQLDTGGFIENDGLAMLHAGERVMPAAQVDRGRAPTGDQPPQNVNVNVSLGTDDEALRQWVDNRADVVVERTVEDALRQAERRRTL